MYIEPNGMDEVALVGTYQKQGYICLSNKYRIIGRPDREDWHIVLAKHMNCAPADFIKQDGSGKLSEQWREHYIRGYSTDKIENIPAYTYNQLKKFVNR